MIPLYLHSKVLNKVGRSLSVTVCNAILFPRYLMIVRYVPGIKSAHHLNSYWHKVVQGKSSAHVYLAMFLFSAWTATEPWETTAVALYELASVFGQVKSQMTHEFVHNVM